MKSTLKISALVLAFAGLTLGAKAQTTTSTTKTSTLTFYEQIVTKIIIIIFS